MKSLHQALSILVCLCAGFAVDYLLNILRARRILSSAIDGKAGAKTHQYG